MKGGKAIGPSFPSELDAAGLLGLPFSWGTDGDLTFDPRMTPAQTAAVQAVYAAHDPTKPAPATPLAAALDAALAGPQPTLPQIRAVLAELRKGVH